MSLADALRFVPVLAVLASCATYREDLNRGQRLYEEREYERALAIFRNLELDADSLELNDRARYAYLRGMTDYRLGFRPHARHWLAIARATEQEHPGGLAPEWKERMNASLDELDRDVYRADRGQAEPSGTTPENPEPLDAGTGSTPEAAP